MSNIHGTSDLKLNDDTRTAKRDMDERRDVTGILLLAQGFTSKGTHLTLNILDVIDASET